jgi:hypothetical protein
MTDDACEEEVEEISVCNDSGPNFPHHPPEMSVASSGGNGSISRNDAVSSVGVSILMCIII